MKFASLMFVLPFALAVSGCATFEGLKNDFASMTNSFSSSTAPAEVKDPDEARRNFPVYDGVCPPVTVRSDLKHLVEFYDSEKTTDSAKVSEADILGVQNTCRVENGAIVMQIDISLYGKTGPKARMAPTDKPSFAYPYFVAVTDAQGNVVSKEIFAASLSYGANQKDINQTESIFQNMPVPDKAAGQNYQVIVGFQLTEDQLAYNQKMANAPAAPEPAPPKVAKKPATKPAAKTTVN